MTKYPLRGTCMSAKQCANCAGHDQIDEGYAGYEGTNLPYVGLESSKI